MHKNESVPCSSTSFPFSKIFVVLHLILKFSGKFGLNFDISDLILAIQSSKNEFLLFCRKNTFMNVIRVEKKHFVFKIESAKRLSRAYSVQKIPETDDKDRLVVIRGF